MKILELFESQMSEKEIYKWMKDHWEHETYNGEFDQYKTYVFHGKVNSSKNVVLDLKGENLPFEFADEMDNGLKLRNPKSLKGCPRSVRFFQITSDSQISFNDAPNLIGEEGNSGIGIVALFVMPSVEGIHKHIKQIHGSVQIGHGTKGILDILKIKGVTNAKFVQKDGLYGATAEEEKINDIIMKYRTKDGFDLVKIQREIINADLEDLL